MVKGSRRSEKDQGNNDNHHNGSVPELIVSSRGSGEAAGAVLKSLRKLIVSGNAETQRAAYRSLGTFLYENFAEVYPYLRGWAEDKNPLVRRAVAMAVFEAVHPFRFDLAEPLLRLVELLLPDKAAQVRWAVGPKVIAQGLLPAYPDDTFEYLTKWSTVHDEQVLWNVAMGLSGAAAIRRTSKALIILRRLALDERRYVWRAVASAMWRLGRRDPTPVLAELRRWLADDDRAHVARVALQHI